MSRKYRVFRGGSFNYGSWFLRSTVRYRFEPEFRDRFIGFRVVIRRSPQ